MTNDLLTTLQAVMDAYEHRWDKPQAPMIAYIARWEEKAAFVDISMRENIPFDEVTHAHLQAFFQKYGFDDYEVFSAP